MSEVLARWYTRRESLVEDRFHWLMQCAIVERKLMRILSSVVIRVVLFSNSSCLVWVSTLFPRPGIASDVELYQNLRKEALNNTRQIPSQNSHMSQNTPSKQSHKLQQTPGQTSHMSPQTPIKQLHTSHHTLGKQSHITQYTPSKKPHTSQPTPGQQLHMSQQTPTKRSLIPQSVLALKK